MQNRLIKTGQTGGQRYSDTSPFSIPWLNPAVVIGIIAKVKGVLAVELLIAYFVSFFARHFYPLIASGGWIITLKSLENSSTAARLL